MIPWFVLPEAFPLVKCLYIEEMMLIVSYTTSAFFCMKYSTEFHLGLARVMVMGAHLEGELPAILTNQASTVDGDRL
jgi:hypothetical protein